MIELEDGTFSYAVAIRKMNGSTEVGILNTEFDGKELTKKDQIKFVIALVKKELLGSKTVLVRVK